MNSACMQCQNEALADSNVSLAADLRLEVHDLLLKGKSDDEIRDFLVARYGEFILFRPRMNLHNAWLWEHPACCCWSGCSSRCGSVRARSRLPITDEDPADHSAEA